MQLYKIFERAAHLTGMGDMFLKENDSSDISERALTAVNTVLFDLCEEREADSLFEEREISPACADAAAYGTAMFLSLTFGDTEKSDFLSKIYNAKRAKIKSTTEAAADKLPKVSDAL